MGLVSGGGGGGNTTAQVTASGKVVPNADPSGATVNSTTYDNQVTGVGKYTTLVVPADTAVAAMAIAGDTFPRIVAQVGEGSWWMGDGVTADPTNMAAVCYGGNTNRGPHFVAIDRYLRIRSMGLLTGNDPTVASQGGEVGDMWLRSDGPPWAYICTVAGIGGAATWVPVLTAGSPLGIITSGALPTVALVSGTGAQILTSRDAETVTPVTFNPGAATTATCTVALSPDNVTYSTLGIETEPVGVAFDGTIHLIKVRVPAGWYLKLTVNAQAVLGTTTYY